MMFGIKFDHNEKKSKHESPKQSNIMENSRNFSLNRNKEKNKDEEPGFLSIIRESTSESANAGTSKVIDIGKKELISGHGHSNSTVIVKDYRPSVFQLNTIKEEP